VEGAIRAPSFQVAADGAPRSLILSVVWSEKPAYDPPARFRHGGAIVATIKALPGKREEYLKHLKAHAQRCLATEPGTLKFEILVPAGGSRHGHAVRGLCKPGGLRGALDRPVQAASHRDWKGLKVSATGVRCDIVE
jgi:hypothetical protein